MLFVLFVFCVGRIGYYYGKKQAFKEMDQEISNYENGLKNRKY